MSEESNNGVPQIAITAYESNEEDVEVTNILNATEKKTNIKVHEPRSVSPLPMANKSRIILKSPITNNLRRSLSPCLSNLNNLTDVEIMSDSDDEKHHVRTPNLTPGPIDYFILTDVEDLSEDEEHENIYNNVKEEHTDTENFTDDKGLIIDVEKTEPSESLANFPEPHREILIHSKDGKISVLPTEESSPIGLKTPKEEVKGFDSEEEIITAEEFEETELYLKNNNTYYHDIDVGVEESVETIKHERCKHKYRNRVLNVKKNAAPEIEYGKKRFRNKNRSSSEIEESVEKCLDGNKKKMLSKYMSEPILSKVLSPIQIQNNNVNSIIDHRNSNKFTIHDNRNDFSISIDLETHNSILLSVGRDCGNLSVRWLNNGIMTGRVTSDCDIHKTLESLEPGYFFKSSLYDPIQQYEVDLFSYGTTKILQNRYFTYIAVYTVVQPINIVQLYINRPFQTQIILVKKPLVKVYSLKDKCTSMERLYPSPVTRLSAFKIFNQKETEKHEEPKEVKIESKNHVSGVIDIFENMSNSPKLRRKFNFKKLSSSDNNLKINNFKQKLRNIHNYENTHIGN